MALAELVDKIEVAVKAELPDAKAIRITYDPGHPEIPLSIVVFRI